MEQLTHLETEELVIEYKHSEEEIKRQDSIINNFCDWLDNEKMVLKDEFDLNWCIDCYYEENNVEKHNKIRVLKRVKDLLKELNLI